MHTVDNGGHQHADHGVQQTVKGKNGRVCIGKVIDGDHKKNHTRKISHFLHVHNNSGIEHKNKHRRHQQIVQILIEFSSADQLTLNHQQEEAPHRPDHRAENSLSCDTLHIFCIGLHTLHCCQRRVQWDSSVPTQHINNQAQCHRNSRAYNPLSGKGDSSVMFHYDTPFSFPYLESSSAL